MPPLIVQREQLLHSRRLHGGEASFLVANLPVYSVGVPLPFGVGLMRRCLYGAYNMLSQIRLRGRLVMIPVDPALVGGRSKVIDPPRPIILHLLSRCRCRYCDRLLPQCYYGRHWRG